MFVPKQLEVANAAISALKSVSRLCNSLVDHGIVVEPGLRGTHIRLAPKHRGRSPTPPD